MPRYKVIEYRTTPHVYEVEAKNRYDALNLNSGNGKVKYVGRDDDTDVFSEVELLRKNQEVTVEYEEE